ncbi:Redoxin [Scheffersomyces amazonensis]|uniref:Redoxin n=1 Tax=Scheffersomyces amazonensis TaxID=1078765 RepID=UPI00315D6AEA
MAEVKQGDQFPKDVELSYIPIDISNLELLDPLACQRPINLKLDSLFGVEGKIVIVAVPGAFTPTCTENHIPPFITHLAQLKEKLDVNHILIISTNDAFVNNAWGKLLLKQGLRGVKIDGEVPKVYFASDTKGSFSQPLGLFNAEADRTKRYALIVDQKTAKFDYVGVEVERGVKFSGIDAVLSARL